MSKSKAKPNKENQTQHEEDTDDDNPLPPPKKGSKKNKSGKKVAGKATKAPLKRHKDDDGIPVDIEEEEDEDEVDMDETDRVKRDKTLKSVKAKLLPQNGSPKRHEKSKHKHRKHKKSKKLITQPKGTCGKDYHLVQAMGLAPGADENWSKTEIQEKKLLYNSLRSGVQELSQKAHMDWTLGIKKQPVDVVGSLCSMAQAEMPYLGLFKNHWATVQILISQWMNKRDYNIRKTKLLQPVKDAKGKRIGLKDLRKKAVGKVSPATEEQRRAEALFNQAIKSASDHGWKKPADPSSNEDDDDDDNDNDEEEEREEREVVFLEEDSSDGEEPSSDEEGRSRKSKRKSPVKNKRKETNKGRTDEVEDPRHQNANMVNRTLEERSDSNTPKDAPSQEPQSSAREESNIDPQLNASRNSQDTEIVRIDTPVSKGPPRPRPLKRKAPEIVPSEPTSPKRSRNVKEELMQLADGLDDDLLHQLLLAAKGKKNSTPDA
ncbi:uncharacterized protein BXZ73DRAFT_101921 [Epithele typhae]|uniref:uncharacterized protein n=1 Tax=Epithele typhae TaxID=378194 RepID=UPI002007E10F|nr:uncharacterized protein BXZ73DRAFT_101921 [Epithele typhae]KAH9929853.1 hypothetical protein BXZ73DRAFT_101921 [Epithele typhae]